MLAQCLRALHDEEGVTECVVCVSLCNLTLVKLVLCMFATSCLRLKCESSGGSNRQDVTQEVGPRPSPSCRKFTHSVSPLEMKCEPLRQRISDVGEWPPPLFMSKSTVTE